MDDSLLLSNIIKSRIRYYLKGKWLTLESIATNFCQRIEFQACLFGYAKVTTGIQLTQ